MTDVRFPQVVVTEQPVVEISVEKVRVELKPDASDAPRILAENRPNQPEHGGRIVGLPGYTRGGAADNHVRELKKQLDTFCPNSIRRKTKVSGSDGLVSRRVSWLPGLFLLLMADVVRPGAASPWQSSLLQGSANAVALDSKGDVVAAGRMVPSPGRGDFAVAKLSGENGGQEWRYLVNGDSNEATSLAIDPPGNVVATGRTKVASINYVDLTVVKLSGGDGTELWRSTINGDMDKGDSANAVALDSLGDVIVAGLTRNLPGINNNDFTVVKLSRTDGTELWRRSLRSGDGGRGALAVAVDPGNDVGAAGEIDHRFSVMKLSAGSGATLWTQDLGSSASTAWAVAFGDTGHMVAAGVG